MTDNRTTERVDHPPRVREAIDELMREKDAIDNRTTELLRKLLDERGVKWKDGDASYEIEWSTPDGRHCSAMYWKPTFTVLISGCTPEQAIAATLGAEYHGYEQAAIEAWESIKAWNTRATHGTLTAEQVSKAVYAHSIHADCTDADWHAIADELNARAERTCRIIEYDEAPYPVCSECGAVQPDDYTVYFCWNCGAKVRNE